VLFNLEPPMSTGTSSATPTDTGAARPLRVPDAARLLGVSWTTLYQLVAKGEIPALRLGKSIRIARQELEQRVQSLGAT
jgi:excisionase family DNA binding protein